MSILIKKMEMPKNCGQCFLRGSGCKNRLYDEMRPTACPLVEVPTPHGRLIDADKLHKAMYHRAFETDGDTMWQSGCWVRYRAIEKVQDGMPTIIEAEEGEPDVNTD